ncbi:MAG: hypothetical protein VZR06_17725, partial [Butyrivibrio sp.]|nr:hypothetical protein [Butyrivibrio sp.]
KDQILLENVDSSMGLSRSVSIDLIVYVDPKAYYNLPYADKPNIASIIGKVNWTYRDKGRHMMLIVPGRIGTSSPELGVPTTFADISEFEAVCEVEEKEAGYNPELSYGSHIFQDLVEADILYTAVFSGEKTVAFAPEKFARFKDITGEFCDRQGVVGTLGEGGTAKGAVTSGEEDTAKGAGTSGEEDTAKGTGTSGEVDTVGVAGASRAESVLDVSYSRGDSNVVSVYDLSDSGCMLYYDLEANHLMLKM